MKVNVGMDAVEIFGHRLGKVEGTLAVLEGHTLEEIESILNDLEGCTQVEIEVIKTITTLECRLVEALSMILGVFVHPLAILYPHLSLF